MTVKKIFYFVFLATLSGCAGPAKHAVTDHAVSIAPVHGTQKVPIEALGTVKLPGLISDMNVSKDGSAILVATNPNREVVPGGSSQYMVTRLSTDGSRVRTAWKNPLKSAVKSQAISDDGALSVVSTYDDRITAFDAAGKQLWRIDGLCAPHILSQAKKIVCYHDDDAEPGIAFRVLDWNGKALLSFPIVNDILAFRISEDGRHLALGLTRGQVLLIGSDFRSIWQKKVDGEIVDVAISSAAEPEIIVSSGEKLTVFDAKGGRVSEVATAARPERIALSSTGSMIWAYANSPDGQRISAFKLSPGKIAQAWSRSETRYADLPPIVSTLGETVMIGFEDIIEGNSRHHHLLSFDADGRITWNIPFEPTENLYLGDIGGEIDGTVVAAAMDDGSLSVFRIRRFK